MSRLLLDIDLTAEPVNGWLQDEEGKRRRFVGWLGLTGLLGEISRQEDLLAGDGSDPPPDRG